MKGEKSKKNNNKGEERYILLNLFAGGKGEEKGRRQWGGHRTLL